MKKKAVISLALAVIVTLSGCSERENEESVPVNYPNEVSSNDGNESKADKKIGHDLALISALRHVGLTEAQVTRVKSRLERDEKGEYVYSVEFSADNHLHEFDIEASSGDILKYVLDGETIDGAGSSSESEVKITESDAKTIALRHAKLSESAVTFTEVKLESKDGALAYDVEFTKDSDEYDYTVDAVTGVILEFSVEKAGTQSSSSSSAPASSSSSKPASSSKPQSSSKPASSSKPQSSSKPASSSKPQSSSKPASSSKPQSSSKPASSSKPQSSSKPASSSAAQSKNITENQAKEIAVKHAKLLAENVTFKEVKTKTDNGVLVYDIEFVTGETEYEYTIDAATGDIIEYSSEKLGTTSDPQSTEKISEWQAKNTAAVHAGLSANRVSFNKVKLEESNGVWEYDIEFVSGDTEYEYKINAVSGEIIEHSSEKIAPQQPAGTQITVDQAKEAALKHSGAAADKAVFTEAKLDGTKYEIEFTADGFKFDYEINASDGSVIKSEKETLFA